MGSEFGIREACGTPSCLMSCRSRQRDPLSAEVPSDESRRPCALRKHDCIVLASITRTYNGTAAAAAAGCRVSRCPAAWGPAPVAVRAMQCSRRSVRRQAIFSEGEPERKLAPSAPAHTAAMRMRGQQQGELRASHARRRSSREGAAWGMCGFSTLPQQKAAAAPALKRQEQQRRRTRGGARRWRRSSATASRRAGR